MKQLVIISLFLIAANNLVIAADANAGKKIAGSVCLACHGADGNSFSPMWPNLAGQSASYLSKQLMDFREGRRTDPQMAAMVANLSDQDIANLADYYNAQTLKGGMTEEKYVALGSQLYTGGAKGVMACTGCHGPKGAGLEAAGFPQVSGQKIQYVINQLNNFKKGTRSNDTTGMMNSIAKAMNENQIEAIANYLAGLH